MSKKGKKYIKNGYNCIEDCGNKVGEPGNRCVKCSNSKIRLNYDVGSVTRKPFGESAFLHVISMYKRSARYKKIDFSLSVEEMRILTKSNCHYCGSEPSNKLGENDKTRNGYYIYNGLDRVDNKKGYTKDNVVPCCIICNRSKHALSYSEWLSWLDRVKNFRR